MYVYADNAATTAMSETALEAMLPCLREEYANPSSLHTPGQRAAEKLTEAREIFARHLGASPAEITFPPAAASPTTRPSAPALCWDCGRGRSTSSPPSLNTTRCFIRFRLWRRRALR